MISADYMALVWVVLAIAVVLGGFAFLGRHDFRKTALAIGLGEVALTVWALLANREADNDVDIIVTGLSLAAAVVLILVSTAGWGVGRLWRRRSGA